MAFARNILATGAIALVAGCTTQTIRTPGDSSVLNIRSVSVDTSNMESAVTGREIALTTTQLDTDLTAALTAQLSAASDPSGVASDVIVVVESVDLAPVINRAAGATSSITAVVTVTEEGTGRVIVPSAQLTGNTDSIRGAGVIGIATTRTVEQDYRGTLSGFASTVREALFGA